MPARNVLPSRVPNSGCRGSTTEPVIGCSHPPAFRLSLEGCVLVQCLGRVWVAAHQGLAFDDYLPWIPGWRQPPYHQDVGGGQLRVVGVQTSGRTHGGVFVAVLRVERDQVWGSRAIGLGSRSACATTGLASPERTGRGSFSALSVPARACRVSPSRGLGLAIARPIVRDHQGELDVESDPDIRSRCIVRLPSGQGTMDASSATRYVVFAKRLPDCGDALRRAAPPRCGIRRGDETADLVAVALTRRRNGVCLRAPVIAALNPAGCTQESAADSGSVRG
jgi:hypothetical protein